MNTRLTSDEIDGLLAALERAILYIRLAGYDGDAKKAAAIADAFHNVPRLLMGNVGVGWDTTTWSVQSFREMFLDQLAREYPDLAGLEECLPARKPSN